jgi:hypothetical protein
MSGSTQARPLFQLFCYLYMLLGAISTGTGALLLIAPGLFFPAQRVEHTLLQIIGGIFLVFGIVRIVNALIQLRRPRGSVLPNRDTHQGKMQA